MDGFGMRNMTMHIRGRVVELLAITEDAKGLVPGLTAKLALSAALCLKKSTASKMGK